MKFGLVTAAALLALTSAAQASVVIAFNDDGTGSTAYSITGTYDVTAGNADSGTNIGLSRITSLAGDILFEDFADNVQTSTRSYSSTQSDGALLSMGINETFSTLDANFGFQLFGNGGTAYLFAETADPSGTINLSGTFSTIAFSRFNTGVWEWGDVSQDSQGIRLEVGQVAPVPLPAGGALLLGGLMALRLARRTKT